MLQLSNYWHTGETIEINLLPDFDITELLLTHKKQHPKQLIRTVLSENTDNALPKKLLVALQTMLWEDVKEIELANIKDERLTQIGQAINGWQLKPSGTEGYRTAEVTRGGIDTDEVSSKTMESKLQKDCTSSVKCLMSLAGLAVTIFSGHGPAALFAARWYRRVFYK